MEKYETPKIQLLGDLSDSITTALNGSTEGTFDKYIDASDDIF